MIADIKENHSCLRNPLLILGLMAAIFALLTGCAPRGTGPTPTTSLEAVLEREGGVSQEIRTINQQLFASVSSAPQVQDYVLGEGDLIQVTVFEVPELSTEARVGSRGTVSLPLLGAVEITGLTAREAEQHIEDLYGARYLRNPNVNVFVKEQISGKITLLGEVKRPGTYTLLSRQRVLDVLAMAEGLSDRAGRTVQVRRTELGQPNPSTFMIDLDEIIHTGYEEMNMEIRGGDVIYVPEAGMIYVDGAVRRPGNYPIRSSMTIPEAIAAAGGFSTIANENNIKLVRLRDDGEREVIQVGINELRQSTDKILEVRDRDVLFVETDRLETILYGLRLNLGGGLFGIGYTPPRE